LLGFAGPQRGERPADVVSVRAQSEVREVKAPEIGLLLIWCRLVIWCVVVVQIGCHVPLPRRQS